MPSWMHIEDYDPNIPGSVDPNDPGNPDNPWPYVILMVKDRTVPPTTTGRHRLHRGVKTYSTNEEPMVDVTDPSWFALDPGESNANIPGQCNLILSSPIRGRRQFFVRGTKFWNKGSPSVRYYRNFTAVSNDGGQTWTTKWDQLPRLEVPDGNPSGTNYKPGGIVFSQHKDGVDQYVWFNGMLASGVRVSTDGLNWGPLITTVVIGGVTRTPRYIGYGYDGSILGWYVISITADETWKRLIISRDNGATWSNYGKVKMNSYTATTDWPAPFARVLVEISGHPNKWGGAFQRPVLEYDAEGVSPSFEEAAPPFLGDFPSNWATDTIDAWISMDVATDGSGNSFAITINHTKNLVAITSNLPGAPTNALVLPWSSALPGSIDGTRRSSVDIYYVKKDSWVAIAGDNRYYSKDNFATYTSTVVPNTTRQLYSLSKFGGFYRPWFFYGQYKQGY